MKPAWKKVKAALKSGLRRAGVTWSRRMGGFIVKETPGKGRGLFAARDYAALEALLPLSGRVRLARSGMTIQVGPDVHVEPDEPLVFSNHSCEPAMGLRADAKGRVGFFARRAVRAGEELTWDYATSESDFVVGGAPGRIECLCGAPACRRVLVNGWQDLSPAQKRAYDDWRMPYLKP